MNNKILVTICVPLLESNYEVYLPINRKISTIIKLLEKALMEITNGYYPNKDNSVVIDEKSGNVYDINITVKESKMMNGSKIILI